MSERDLSYAVWRARRGRDVERRNRLKAGLPPFRRYRLRSVNEARFLRQIGTPEPLIGPVGTDEEVACQREELVEFARRLRAVAGRSG